MFEQALPSLQFGSDIWRDPQDRGPEAYVGSGRARGHSSLRDKTTYLLVGSLCGTAPAPRRCTQACWDWGEAPAGPALMGRGLMGQPDPSATFHLCSAPVLLLTL